MEVGSRAGGGRGFLHGLAQKGVSPIPLLPHPLAPPTSGEQEEVKRDWISQMPDDILIRILSLLPDTKHRARTCILSRRWRHLWTHCPTLEFLRNFYGENLVPNGIYCRSVDRCLQACRAATLTRFTADVVLIFEDGEVVDARLDVLHRRADRWIRLAAGRSVQELSLRFFRSLLSPEMPVLETPLSVMACARSLTALNLQHCDFTNFPCNAGGFPSLRTLQLYLAILPNDKLLPLLSMCPLLEGLSLYFCRDLTSIEVSSSVNPNLKDLKIGCDFSVVIDVPDLRSLQFDGDITGLCFKNGPPLCLREAGLHSLCPPWKISFWRAIMSALSHVEILSVNAWFFKLMAMAGNANGEFIFRNLKEFACSIKESNLSTFFFFVQGCPHLEKLYIKMIPTPSALGKRCRYHPRPRAHNEGGRLYGFVVDGSRPLLRHEHAGEGPLDEAAGKSMLPRLKSATIIDFSPRRRLDMRLAELLLQESGVLERLLLKFPPEQGMDEGAIREQVCSLPRASPAAQIIASERSILYPFRMDGADEEQIIPFEIVYPVRMDGADETPSWKRSWVF